ncbi:MAG: hypothetical protein AB8B50_18175 [Pirellulaceae bacterium]
MVKNRLLCCGRTLLLACFAVVGAFALPSKAQAGPLIDWLFGRSNAPAPYPVGTPVPMGSGLGTGLAPANGYAAGYGNYGVGYGNYGAAPANPYSAGYGNYYAPRLPVLGNGAAGYLAPRQNAVASSVLPTANYVPNFRTNSYRGPVTYYRPILATDPNTGAQVVQMAPCTSYQDLTGRVPVPGRTALFGSTVAPPTQPAPRTLPTYTIPNGGIPLAGSPRTVPYAANPYSANPYTATSPYTSTTPYASAYRGYSALQPAVPVPQYSTTPLGNNYYGTGGYGTTGGGSTGSYAQPVPGLAAPQAPVTRTPAPSWGQPTTPPGEAPPGSNVLPPTTSSDPSGDMRPSLPQDFGGSASRGEPASRVHSLVQSPRSERVRPTYPSVNVPSLRSEDSQVTRSKPEVDLPQQRAADGVEMEPIPVPDDFDSKSRWNPGLLREGDMTAQQSMVEIARFAGQTKKIHWASFEEPVAEARRETSSRLRRVQSEMAVPISSVPNVQTRSRIETPAVSTIRSNPPTKSHSVEGWRSSRR